MPDHKILNVLLDAFCKAELADQASRNSRPKEKVREGLAPSTADRKYKPSEMSPREFVEYIAQLSVSSMVFRDKAAEESYAKELGAGYERFQNLLWQQLDFKNYSQKQIDNYLVSLNLYGNGSKHVDEAICNCCLSQNEKFLVISNLKSR